MDINNEKISLVVGCYNRTEFLLESVHSWLTQKIDEIIIVDWGSIDDISSLRDIESLCENNKIIKIVRVNNVNKWILSLALNIGVKYATHSLILKVDCDTVLKNNFFDEHPLHSTDNTFYSGNWKNSRNENETHLNGILFTTKHAFMSVNGYNEYIREYGWDDTDLYQRLCDNGTTQKYINNDSVMHIQHSNKIRAPFDNLKLKIMENSYIAKKYKWSIKNDQTSYINIDTVLKNTKTANVVTLEPVDIEKYTLSHDFISECNVYALRSILADHGFSWMSTERKSRKTLMTLYIRRKKPKLVIKTLNGLGNKLRAMASAAVIAENSDRNLLIVWSKDYHYDANFHDHFDDSYLFVTDTYNNDNFPVIDKDKFDGIASSFSPAIVNENTNSDLYIISSNAISNNHTSWTQESNWLQTHIKPIDSIQQTINYYNNLFSINSCIGLHIRMGQDPLSSKYEDISSYAKDKKSDILYARKNSNYKYFMQEIEKILERYPDQVFFICGDNKEIYTIFNDTYNSNVSRNIVYVPKNLFDRSKDQITSAIIDVMLLSKCKKVLGSPWSSFSELISRFGQKSIRISGKHFGSKKFALLFYPNSYNIGDDIQTIAASCLLPTYHDYLVNRDDQSIIYDSHGTRVIKEEEFNDIENIRIIENGWFDGRLTVFPPNKRLIPLFISFHLNERPDLFDTPLYTDIKHTANLNNKLLTKEVVDYFKGFSPSVGTRDTHTLKLFKNKGIESYHSCCMTLTLSAKKLGFNYKPKKTEIIVVDADEDESFLYNKLIPNNIKNIAIQIKHALVEKTSFDKKNKLARELLEMYYNAKLVITNRLHAALPSMALGTPIIFLYSDMDKDPRFDSVLKTLLGDGKSVDNTFNWKDPVLANEKKVLINTLSEEIIKKVSTFLE